MTGWATLGTGESVELASPGARLGARLLDIVIMFAVFIILVLIFGISVSGSDGDGLAVGALFVGALLFGLVGIAYEVTMIALKGQTVGKMATSVKVVRADNGLLPGWGKSIGRWAIPALLPILPFVGWLLSLLCYVALTWDKSRQGWHDKAAATLVVKT